MQRRYKPWKIGFEQRWTKLPGLVLALFFASCQAGDRTAETVDDRPNIIILLADDMGYSDLGCMGSEIKTPNIDRLARDGVLMTHFYTTSRCCPSRASLMTGQYAHRAGIGHMNADWGLPSYQGHLSQEAATIPELLKEGGYTTLMAGKWHIGDERPNWPIDRGFDQFYGIPAGGGVYFWPPVGLKRDVYLNDEIQTQDSTWYSTDAFTDYAIRFVKEAKMKEKPFFLYGAYIAPHFPLQAWPEDIKKYEGYYDEGYGSIQQQRLAKQKELNVLPPNTTLPPPDFPDWATVKQADVQARKMQVHAAMIDRLDQNVGRLIKTLEEEGQLDNTVIFFLSDNGGCPNGRVDTPEEEIGSRSSFVAYGKSWANVSNTPYRKYKAMTHEGGLLTPLVAHWPAGIKEPGQISHEPAHIIDFMATCLDLAGLDYPTAYNGHEIHAKAGQSFVPLLQGEKAPADRILFWEHEGNQAVRQGFWKLVRRKKKDWELYNLEKDPTELNDLRASEKEKVEELLRQYRNWADSNGVKDWPVNRR